MAARYIVGVLGAPIAIYLVYRGGLLFAAALAALAAIGGFEYTRLAQMKSWKPSPPVLMGGALLFMLDASLFGGKFSEPALALVLLAGLSVQVMRGIPANGVGGPALETFGAIYCGWTLSKLLLIRTQYGDAGFGLAMGVLVVVWMGDLGAFFTGIKFGRTKLAPALSPRKTVEGAVGGAVWSLTGSAVFKLLGDATGLWYTLEWPHALTLAALLSLSGQIGDLAESAMKRDAGVKDAGRLFPGHGGVLDRFDSLLFASPVAYYYIRLVL
ncbi:MAG: phosphatidate cytidylyltransferase [Firmicutes bacterium]|nr:phosphatidate cytidylyltransferase [Bacillota bacterium]